MNVFQMGYKRVAPMNFVDLPPAALNSGRAMRCNPLVAGQPYFWMESDGQFWRPLCGAQVLYTLAAEIVFTSAAGYQLGVSVPLPPGLLPDQRSMLRTVVGVDKIGGVADTFTLSQRVGVTLSSADPIAVSAACVTTNISSGTTNQVSRQTATTVRKQGVGATGSNVALSGVAATVRAAAITVSNMDTETNYWILTGALGIGGIGEYGVLHAFTLELIG